MKKTLLQTLYMLGLCSTLVACGNPGTSSVTPTDTEKPIETVKPSDTEKPSETTPNIVDELPSLREVMTNIANLRNYTYTMEDQILDVTTTMYFAENYYYYQPSQEKHGGKPYGYAQSKENQVFNYVIENEEVVPGEVCRNKDGKIITDLWNQQIISFYDFKLDGFSAEKTEDNKYQITDPSNKLLFALMAGYGDGVTTQYIDVTVEVTGEESFVATVHFAPEGSSAYTGDVICTLHDIDSTRLDPIYNYLEAGLGPKEENPSEDLYAVLNAVKSAKKYKVEVTTDTTHYVDIFNDEYYYSDNKKDASKSKGYVKLQDKVYNFKMTGETVSLGEEVNYMGSTSRDIWTLNLFKNFSLLNLSNASFEALETGEIKLATDVSSLTTFYNMVHSSAFFGSVDPKTDYALFTNVTETGFDFLFHKENEMDYKVSVSEIGTAKNQKIEDFIASVADFDENDTTALKDKLNLLKTSKNYTVEVKETFGAFTPNLDIGNSVIQFTENEYYLNNSDKADKSIGYHIVDGKVTSYLLKNGQKEDVETLEQTDLYAVISSFAQYDESLLQAKKNMDLTYSVTSVETINQIGEMVGFPKDTLANTVKSFKVTLSDNDLVFVGDGGMNGKVTITVNKIGSTVIA